MERNYWAFFREKNMEADNCRKLGLGFAANSSLFFPFFFYFFIFFGQQNLFVPCCLWNKEIHMGLGYLLCF